MTLRQYCTLEVAGLTLGIEALRIREIIADLAITPVPLAPHAFRGLVNLRGALVTVVDLRQRFGVEDPDDADAVHIVVDDQDAVTSLLVDAVGDIIEVDVRELQPPPPTLDPLARSLVTAMCKLDSGLMLVLDEVAAIEGQSP